jgi:hypothetical protein
LIYINAKGQSVQYLEPDLLFYALLSVAILFNGGWLALGGVLRRTSPDLEYTINGVSLIQIAFNLFFGTAVYFINVLNSRENFDYSNFGLLIYITGGLLIAALVYTLVSRLVLKK